MSALRKPKGYWWSCIVVLEGEEANAAVDKGPRVVHVVHKERAGGCTVSLKISRTSFDPSSLMLRLGLDFPILIWWLDGKMAELSFIHMIKLACV